MRLLDLFCGAGGAAVGYNRAGFTEIIGVDLTAQPRYPFTFVQADALEYLARELLKVLA
jgi:DNA (cytosine-5)-methyltransferase 1